MLQRPKFGFEPTSRIFAMAHGAQTVRLWDLNAVSQDERSQANAELKTGRSTLVGLFVVSAKLLVTVHQSGRVVGWKLDSVLSQEEPTVVWEQDLEMVVATSSAVVEAAAERRCVVCGGDSGQVALIGLGTGGDPQVVQSDRGHDDKVEVIEISPGGDRVATAGRGRDIVIWSLDAGDTWSLTPRRRLTESQGWPLSLAFSSSGKRLISGCMDNGVYLWNLDADEPLEAVRIEHHGWVEDVEWVGDDETILSASWDSTAIVYDADTLQPKFQFMYHDDYVVRLVAVPDTSLVFAGSYDGEVSVWDWQRGRLEQVLEGHDDWVTELAWLGDERVASLSGDRTVRLWSSRELASVAVLGDPMVQDFDFDTAFDRSDYGLEDYGQHLGGDSRSSLDRRQSKVVRRFDDEPMRSDGGQAPAMSLLEEALDNPDELESDDVFGDEHRATTSAEEAKTQLDEAIDPADGDSLLDIDRSKQSNLDDLGGDDLQPDLEDFGDGDDEDLPPDAVTQKLDPDQFDLGDSPGSSDELDNADPDEFLGNSKIEDHRQPELSDIDGSGDSGQQVGIDEAFSSVDGDSDVEFPDASDVAEEAFEQVHGDGDVDIMDSVFDPVSDEPDDHLDEADSDEPKAVGPDDDLSELLPDDEELDLALSSSVADSAEEPAVGDEYSAPSSRSGREVDRPDPGEEQLEDDEEDSSGKPKPSSARGVRDGAGGGEQRSRKESAPTASTTQTPFSAVESNSQAPSGDPQAVVEQAISPGEPTSGPADPAGAMPDSTDQEGKGHQTMTPFTSPRQVENKAGKPVTSDSIPGVNKEVDDPESGESKDSKKRRKLKTLSKNLKKKLAGQKSSSTEESSSPKGKPKTDRGDVDDKAGPLEEVLKSRTRLSEAKRRRRNTTMPGGGPKPDGAQRSGGIDEANPFDERTRTDEIDAESVARLDRESSQADETDETDETSNGSRQSGVGDEDSSSRGLKGRRTRGFRFDEDDLPSDEQFDGLGPDSDVETPPRRIGDEGTASRLMPGDSVDKEQLNIPEPDRGRTVADEETTASTTFNSMTFDELWDRSASTAPKMGVLKTSKPSTGDYTPDHRYETDHRGELALALSSQHHRLMTAGKEGEVKLWGDDGRPQLTFVVPGRSWMEVGFIDKERLLYGVARSGIVDLWLLPDEHSSGDGTIAHASVEQTGVKYRCATLDDEKSALLVGSESGTAYVWSLSSGECVMRLTGHDEPVAAVTFGTRGPITAGTDGTIRFWNRQGLQIDQIDISGEVRGLATAGDSLLWVESSGKIRRMTEGGRGAAQLKGHFGEGKTAVSRDESTWVSGGDDGRILVYDLEGDKPHQEIQVPAPVHRLVASSRKLVAASAGGVVFAFRRT